jgi:hypothetical protein
LGVGQITRIRHGLMVLAEHLGALDK